MLANDEKETNYYMHGGTIVWDADNGKISDFIPPTEQTVTNDMAKAYGHIAIDPETGSASVSYSGLDDASSHYDIDGNKVYVKLRGKCSGCKNSTLTLKAFVETSLREAVSKDIEVIEVGA